MQKPKKIFNNTDNIRSEIMEGLVYTGRGKIHALPEYCAVYRTMAQNNQTVIVSVCRVRRRRRHRCLRTGRSLHLPLSRPNH